MSPNSTASGRGFFIGGKLVAEEDDISVDRLVAVLTCHGYALNNADGSITYMSYRFRHRYTMPEEQKVVDETGHMPKTIERNL